MRLAVRRSAFAFVLVAALLVAPALARAAPSFAVNSTLDESLSTGSGGQCVSTPSGVCTLRAAIEEINTLSGGGNIAIPAGTYTLSLGVINITGAPTISGAGAGSTIIDGGGVDRVFQLYSGASGYIEKVTIRNGVGTLDSVTGHGHGGCIHNHGQLILVDSTVSGCQALPGWGGGGIANAGAGTLTAVNDTIINSASDNGGGLENGGTATLDNVTIANNSGSSAGGVSSGTMRINNTIVANNVPDNCGAAVIVEASGSGNNLDSGHTCGFVASGDLQDTDPLLGALQSDGTLPLQLSSPAIDTGDTSPANCPSTDERALARPQDGDGNGTALCDIGAYEAPTPNHLTATGVGCSPNSVAAGDSTICTATVSDTSAGPKTTPTGTVTFTSNSVGGFGGGGSCTLSQASPGVASCQVSYGSTSLGAQPITAGYGSDGEHATSTGTTTVTVSNRSTGSVVSCSPNSVAAGDSTICTATVSDTSAGPKTTPTGTVTFTSNSVGGFGGGGSCTLSQASPGVASCQVSYSSTSLSGQTITASYGGDSVHATSTGATTVTVSNGSSGGTGGGGNGGGGTGGGGTAAAVGRVRTFGTNASVRLRCPGGTGNSCVLRLTLAATKTVKNHKFSTANAKGTKQRVVVLGGATVTVPAGQSKTVQISLNRAGKRLLSMRRTLKVKLTVSQPATGTSRPLFSKRLTFKAKPGRRRKH